jgi:hypothetical protein
MQFVDQNAQPVARMRVLVCFQCNGVENPRIKFP